MSIEFSGMDITSPVNRLKSGHVAVAQNVRAYRRLTVMLRNALTNTLLSVGTAFNNLARLNDSTPAGPSSGFTYIISAGTSLFAGSTGTLSAIATGFSGNQVSIVPFRPNTSVQPWGYVGDSAPYPNVAIGSFNCAGMVKVRSDNLTRKMGVAEPQAAPTVTFPGGGSGPSQIFYYYVYRASETGATSNPSPVSIPGTNSQSNPTQTIPATSHANFIFNGAQYEFNGTQIRTTGSVSPGTTTDFISVNGFTSIVIPANVTIDGISVDLNWVGQNSGTGVLTTVSLFYLGAQYGNPKFPGTQNQSFSTDTIQGGSGDIWGATLTPDIVNDPTFGFGVQITTQLAGGSDRSFVNSMGVTVYYSTQDANITPIPSADPQVDKIDFYRQGGGLANPTYIGTGPNSATVFNDQLSDLGAASNPELQFDNYEPFPSIDLPRSGTLNAASQVLTWVSGDHFNIRWLPGTIMLIGTPDQIAYTAVRRPASPTTWDFTNNDTTVPTIPDGTGLVWNISEPDLAAQPLPYLFGPTDNINFMYGVGDPLRPGTLYWCKGGNLDSAPDTNQLEVTDPSEPLVNGAMSTGLGVLFSIKRAWIIQPNFYNALATVTGTQGSTWTLQETAINRGLFIPRCIAVEGGGKIFFRVDDGIMLSVGGGAPQSITDSTLYNLFTHEGSIPQPVTRNGITVYPPNDAVPNKQQFNLSLSFLYYDYQGTDGNPYTLIYHILTNSWVMDTYSVAATTHAPNEGISIQGALVGGSDGNLRQLSSGGTETVTGTLITAAIGGAGWQMMREVSLEYLSNADMTLSFIAADTGNGSYAPLPITVPSSGGTATKVRLTVSVNKWKWVQLQFQSTDPTMQIYLDGLAISTKAWGSTGSFSPIQPFTEAGGIGAQV